MLHVLGERVGRAAQIANGRHEHEWHTTVHAKHVASQPCQRNFPSINPQLQLTQMEELAQLVAGAKAQAQAKAAAAQAAAQRSSAPASNGSASSVGPGAAAAAVDKAKQAAAVRG